MKTIFEISQEGQHAYSLPKNDVSFSQFSPPQHLLRKSTLALPEVSELDLTRHFCGLAARNVGIDNVFYPLGSCTMKLNPRVNEWCAALPEFTQTHPLAPEDTIQGNLHVVYDLITILCKLSGMKAGTLLPCAGAQGEYTGIKMIAEYHKKRGDLKRTEILIPSDAHGTNPATAAMAGFSTVTIRTSPAGNLDIEHLKEIVSERTAGLMLTNPNTLGLFSQNISEIATVIHDCGGLLYYDGANLNAIMNIVRPGDMGFDVMHMNLHKTFSTPHGGGGPGSGPVLCGDKLKSLLPVPRVEMVGKSYRIVWKDPSSIGQICSFHGNFSIYLRAYLYAKLHGNYGLRRISENAVLNANYLKNLIGKYLTVPYPQPCMHEFVVQADNYTDQGVHTLDIAKRMLDYGIYAPTIYFPLIVKECMLIEPTESESKATLDRFIEIVAKIIDEIKENPELVLKAPFDKPVMRLDEVQAARNPILKAQLLKD
ncbi:MAG: aminomethyl-transferring glycine dehydrogenase subunit GcvPB [Parachlamydiaceae bacterium]